MEEKSGRTLTFPGRFFSPLYFRALSSGDVLSCLVLPRRWEKFSNPVSVSYFISCISARDGDLKPRDNASESEDGPKIGRRTAVRREVTFNAAFRNKINGNEENRRGSARRRASFLLNFCTGTSFSDARKPSLAYPARPLLSATGGWGWGAKERVGGRGLQFNSLPSGLTPESRVRAVVVHRSYNSNCNALSVS